MKRKILAILLSLALCICLFSGLTFAADDEVETTAAGADEIPDAEEIQSAFINVSVALAGELVLAHYPVFVFDEDGDGALTVYDALYDAVATYFVDEEHSAEDGLSVSDGFITKFWGVDNGGSYMYYLNNIMCGGLTDPVEDYDFLVIYSFADLEYWSDMYTFFEEDEISISWGEKVELKLQGISFDENWNTVVVPVEGAVITIGGEATEFVTDKDGKVTITLPADSSDPYFEISAALEGQIIVPPSMDIYVDYSNYHEYEFSDVGGHWAENYIYTMVNNGLLKGVSETEFAPDATVTRAMLATVLYRHDGEPEVTEESGFADVAADAWYADAVTWAAGLEIVKGSDGLFRPDAAVTRCEAAVILYRWMAMYVDHISYLGAFNYVSGIIFDTYPDREFESSDEILAIIEADEELSAELAKACEENKQVYEALFLAVDETALDAFEDVGEIPDWAKEAMAWAVTTGILTGTSETTIAPLMTLSRAQLAVILYRAL